MDKGKSKAILRDRRRETIYEDKRRSVPGGKAIHLRLRHALRREDWCGMNQKSLLLPKTPVFARTAA